MLAVKKRFDLKVLIGAKEVLIIQFSPVELEQ